MKAIRFLLYFTFTTNLFFAGEFQDALDFSKKNDWEQAKIHFEKHLAQHPQDALAHYNIGLCLSHQQKFVDALWYFEKSIKLNPGLSEAVSQIEFCHKQLNNAYSWEPPTTYFKSKILGLSLATLSWFSLGISLLLALVIFLSISAKKYRKPFISLGVLLVIFFVFALYFTVEKSNFVSTETHGIIQFSLENTYADKTGNALLPVSVRAGERVELLEKGLRTGIRLSNQTVVWVDSSQVKVY